jgi:hypothetical protein
MSGGTPRSVAVGGPCKVGLVTAEGLRNGQFRTRFVDIG